MDFDCRTQRHRRFHVRDYRYRTQPRHFRNKTRDIAAISLSCLSHEKVSTPVTILSSDLFSWDIKGGKAVAPLWCGVLVTNSYICLVFFWLSPFYADNAQFDVLKRLRKHLLARAVVTTSYVTLTCVRLLLFPLFYWYFHYFVFVFVFLCLLFLFFFWILLKPFFWTCYATCIHYVFVFVPNRFFACI